MNCHKLKKLKPNHKVILMYISFHKKPSYTIRDISEGCSIPKEHVRTYVKELENLNLINLIKYKREIEVIL